MTTLKNNSLLLLAALMLLIQGCGSVPLNLNAPSSSPLPTVSVTMPAEPQTFIKRVEKNIDAWDTTLQRLQTQLTR